MINNYNYKPESSAHPQRWTFDVQSQRPLRSLPHLGSMLRGMFGHGLMESACCAQQPHRPDCVYAQIFEPQAPQDWPKRFSDCPPAYVITPPPFGSADQRRFQFQMTLMGPALARPDLILQAWERAADRGLGTERVQASISVQQRDAQLPLPGRGQRLIFSIHSPLLLKFKQPGAPGQQRLVASKVSFAALLHALHRRLSITHSLYGVPIQSPAPLESWLAQVDKLECRTRLEDVNFARHSNRQQRSMPLCGVIGQVWVNDQLSSDLLEALTLGQWLHIGGKTSFGMGSYSIQFVDAPGVRLCIED